MPEISIKAETLFHIGSFPITNAYLLSLISFSVIILIAVLIKRNLNIIPGKLQSVFETLVEQVLILMDGLLGDRRKSERYLPVVCTIFLFVLISNWLGLMPGVSSILFKEGGNLALSCGKEGIECVPLLRAPGSDLNFTVAIATVAMISVHLFGVLALGFKKHAGKFFTLKNPIYTFVGLLEFISEFVKIVSFSFRLFGNVFAGEVLLGIVGFLVPYFIPLPFLFLEVFVGFIQAFIFSMLTLVFISMSVAEHGEDHSEQSSVHSVQ